jgi:hypothetical protein
VCTREVSKRTPKQFKRDTRALGASEISNLRKLSPTYGGQLDGDMPPWVVDDRVI